MPTIEVISFCGFIPPAPRLRARTTYRHTFLLNGAAGGSGVFSHVAGDRKKLNKIYGVSASVEVMRPVVRDAVLLAGTTKFLTRFAHYARQVIAKQSFMD